jgi:hypothetical protein
MKPIPSAPGYYADELGDIWRNGTRRKAMDNGKGYKRIKLSIGNKQRDAYIHRLVCEAYHGPCPPGFACRHLDGIRDHNSPYNLMWSDKATNEADKVVHGTIARGSKIGTSRLTEAIVMDARRRAAAGERGDLIAASYGVPAHTMRDAIAGRKWKHLPGAVKNMDKGWQRHMRELKRKRAEQSTNTRHQQRPIG